MAKRLTITNLKGYFIVNTQIEIPMTDTRVTASRAYTLQAVMDGNDLPRNAVLERLHFLDLLHTHTVIFTDAAGETIPADTTESEYRKAVTDNATGFIIEVRQ